MDISTPRLDTPNIQEENVPEPFFEPSAEPSSTPYIDLKPSPTPTFESEPPLELPPISIPELPPVTEPVPTSVPEPVPELQNNGSPFTQGITQLNYELDDIDKMLDEQLAFRETIGKQGEHLNFVNQRIDQLDQVAKQMDTNEVVRETFIKDTDHKLQEDMNKMDRKIEQLVEQNKTKQSSLEGAIRDLILVLKEKNEKIVYQEPKIEEVPKMVKQIVNNTEDLNEFKTMDVDPNLINTERETINNNIRLNLQGIQQNQEDISQIKKLLENFKNNFEASLVKIMQTKPETEKTKQKMVELQTLKENQNKIRQAINTGQVQCDLKPTRSNLGRKQNNIAEMCTNLNKEKVKQVSMLDATVKKHIIERRRYTKKYTNHISREMENLRRKVARRNVDLAILLDRL